MPRNQKGMTHIIVPVDMSKNSKEALRYAVHIAARSGARLTIVHCYNLLHKAILYTVKKGYHEKNPQKWIEKRIARIREKHPGMDVRYKIIKGEPTDRLRRLFLSSGGDLVVMGCQGANESPDVFLGSTAGAVVKTTDIPVLLIPPRFRFRGIQRIVFAVKNTFVLVPETLEPIKFIRNSFQPHIQLLHLGESLDPVPERHHSLLPLIHDITRYGNDNFNESIREYLTQYHADLLCVIRRKRGFLEKTLGPQNTPASKFHTDIPVLVLVGDTY